LSSEAEPLTQEELEYIEKRYQETKNKLKGIVTETQIKNKCINLDFDDEKFNNWVSSLVQTDKRVVGLPGYDWNDTVTKESKHAARVQKLA
jgi:hypothetical protein